MSKITLFLHRIKGNGKIGSFHRTVARTVVAQGIMMALSLVVSVLISRKLGTDGRGIASWMIAYSGFGSICAALGMGHALKKYMVRLPEQHAAFIVLGGIILSISLLFSLPLLYAYGMSFAIARDHYAVFLLALAAIPCLTFASLANDIIIALGRELHYNLLLIAEKAALILLSLGLLFGGWVSPLTVVATGMLASGARLLLGLFYLKPYIRQRAARAQLWEGFRIMRRLISSAYFNNMAMFFSGIALTLVLGIVASPEELGYFAVARFLTDAPLMVPATLAAFTLPHLAKEGTAPNAKWAIMLCTLGLMLVVALPLFFFSDDIIRLLYGAAFLPAGQCLHIMTIAMVASGIICVAQPIIAAQHNERMLMLSSGGLAVLIAALTGFFWHRLDAVTASAIYSAAYVGGMLLSLAIIAYQERAR